jgi:hypothetical protein
MVPSRSASYRSSVIRARPKSSDLPYFSVIEVRTWPAQFKASQYESGAFLSHVPGTAASVPSAGWQSEQFVPSGFVCICIHS